MSDTKKQEIKAPAAKTAIVTTAGDGGVEPTVTLTQGEINQKIAEAVAAAISSEGGKNQTVHVQSEGSPYRGRKKFKFNPERHYVWLELPGNHWDSDQIDQLTDEIDPSTGDPAYTIEADGSTEEGRRITGSRRKIWLSCTKEYAKRKEDESSNASQERRLAIAVGESKADESDDRGNKHELVESETLVVKKPVGLKGIIGA